MQVALAPDGAQRIRHERQERLGLAVRRRRPTVRSRPRPPPSVAAGPTPVGIAVSPDGANAYVANQVAQGSIAQFSISADGALTPLDPSLVVTGSQPEGVLATAAGVYVANLGADTVSQYDAGPGGALGPSRLGRSRLRTTPSASRSRPTGSSLYVSGFGASRRRAVRRRQRRRPGPKAPPSVGAGSRLHRPRRRRAARRDGADGRSAHPGGGRAVRAGRSRSSADYSCDDEGGSGLASCEGDVATATRSTPRPRAHTIHGRRARRRG